MGALIDCGPGRALRPWPWPCGAPDANPCPNCVLPVTCTLHPAVPRRVALHCGAQLWLVRNQRGQALHLLLPGTNSSVSIQDQLRRVAALACACGRGQDNTAHRAAGCGRACARPGLQPRGGDARGVAHVQALNMSFSLVTRQEGRGTGRAPRRRARGGGDRDRARAARGLARAEFLSVRT